MKRTTKLVTMAAICTGLAGPALAEAHMDLSSWPEASQEAAQYMMETYGEPAHVTDHELVWYDTGPWKKTVIYDEATTHNFPVEHPDVMQQWIEMDVPDDMFDDLARYDGSVVVNKTEAMISARCDKEGANFLAINLAHDIIQGNKTVEEARQYYGETIQQVMNGETPEYTQGFIFEPTSENLSNPDESIIEK
ncbi:MULTISPECIES: hypothetical protein [Sulfitobacter]|uniref:Uncharacterized protein n=1 Tax=Sulfitobacter profundi TaxID=2679961 RepID=A0ABW1Z3F4_9RHOB|nr:hypothetical protein [Sulfitobacter indolifex]